MRVESFPSPAPLLPDIFALHGKWRRDRPAVLCGSDHLSWGDFCAANHRFANGLLAAGLVPGDRVGVCMGNGLPMVQALFGTLAAGCVSVPLNLSVPDTALAAMLSDAGVRALVVTADQRPRLDALRDALPDSVDLWLVAGAPAPGWDSLESFFAAQPAAQPAVGLDPDAPLNIIYSSGTTGQPKGILHTQRGRRDWAYDLAIALRYHGGARTLLTIGLYSNISWVAMLTTLLAGGTLIIHERFDAGAFLDAVEQEGVTHTAMVPVQFQRVVAAQRQRPRDLSGMQAMMSCGSPLREGLKREIFAAFPCGIIELYGLTEGIITTLDPEDAEGRWDSVGRPLIGTDIAIVGDDDRPCPAGTPGEIVSRGRITMPGYWGRPEANRDARWVDEAGRVWLRSGDIGYVDAQGFLFIVDRKKDMILSGGQNIYPQDIEAVLVTHAAIDDVAVIGAPSARWGETPIALVVPADGGADPAALLAWANGQLGRQQRLADLVFVEALPRNPNGKLLKRELREYYGDRRYD
jgi:acyl-CoA synthetase (AMP-forming)/AMP-acid ligase II